MTTKEFTELVETKGLYETLTDYLERIEDDENLDYHAQQAQVHLDALDRRLDKILWGRD